MRRVSDEERPRTALVAGGTGALGSAVTGVLLARGERVCVPWITSARADRLRSEHADAADAGRLWLVECDVTAEGRLDAVLDDVTGAWGPLWLACSAVGGWAGGTRLAELDDLSLLDEQLRLNLRSAATVAHAGLRHMGEAGGRVVLVGSRTVFRPAAAQAAYTAAKAGVVSLVETLARELRGTGRTANAVVPGVIDTPANRTAMPDSDHSRWVPPEAIAAVIGWLAGAESWPVSGAAIPVAGDS